MGRYTLYIVLAAILGGSMLTLNLQRTSSLTGQDRAEGQAGVLARQIAESGQGVALATATDEDGFVSAPAFFARFGTEPRPYNGGSFQADSFRSYNGGLRADFVVSGMYGRQVPSRHVLASSYEFDPMDYPGPVWLDVPYATSGGGPGRVNGVTEFAGSNVTFNSYFDRTKFENLGSLLDFDAVEASIRAALTGTPVQFPEALATTPKKPQLGTGQVLEDVNVTNAEDLYWSTLNSITPDDRTLGATDGLEHVVTTSVVWDGETTITYITAPLRIASGGRVRGEGVLVVDDGLVVEAASPSGPAGRLDWDGLVIVRSDRETLDVHARGDVTVTGAIVVTQEAAPQVGHMDVTVLKSPDGLWSTPWGLFGPRRGAARPWYEHTHKFDAHPSVRVSETQRVTRFVHDGRAAFNQDSKLIFQQTLDALGSDNVQIRFENKDAHGHGRVTLRLDGEDPVIGSVRTGFPDAFSRGNAYTSAPFPADALEAFTVDIRSLPALQRLFDTEPGCAEPTWPRCVGKNRDRRGALTVQLIHNDRVLYEAALYWHVRTDEWASHLEKMTEWEAEVVSGSVFGTDLDLSGAAIDFDLPNIVRLSDRLGFDGNRVVHRGTRVRHVSADEWRAAQAAGAPPDVAPDVTPTAPTTVCHRPGTPAQATRTFSGGALAAHLGHGDTIGPC